MKESPFVGRKTELRRIQGLLNKKSASLIVVRGRRRIGKSRLLAEFGKGMKSFFFSGNPPIQEMTAQVQREIFSQQLEREGIPGIKSNDWGNLFWHLSKHIEKGKVLIVLDEISWMGGKDPHFLGHLKTAWDMYFSKNSQVIMALCGSISSWIEKNILSHTGFLGRISLDLVLEELSLHSCNQFWFPKENRISAYEKFKFLSVTGGVPLYLEQLDSTLSSEQNILNLCFTKGGLLVREFDEIFSDLFSRRKGKHKELVTALAEGPRGLSQICSDLEKSQGGLYTQYLDELVKAGFVKKEFAWDFTTGMTKKLNQYRLSDNYLRFYLKYISKNRSKIERGSLSASLLNQLPSWESVMGLQFENLVINNFKALWKAMSLSADQVVMDGPFFQNTTTKQKGFQVDYMIQDRFQTLYLCEVKFSKNLIGQRVIQEMEEKRECLHLPKNFSLRPVLIHVNGVEESVLNSGYFDKIIDFSQLLQESSE